MAERACSRLCVFLICLALAVSTFVAYEPVRRNDFINFDDDNYITENPHVRAGITRDTVIWAFTKPHYHMWHPLTSLSHALDCQLFGLNPFWHHLTSLFFHVANTLLLFLVLKKMTGAVWASGFVAAVFALHPLQVESVVWAAERKSVLSGFFWMLTMIAYVRYAERPSIRRYLLIVLAFCLGLLSKSMLVTLPFVLLLLDYWPLGRFQLGRTGENVNRKSHESTNTHFRWPVFYRLVREKVPFFVLSAVLSVVTFISQQGGEVIKRLPLNLRIANAVVSYISYIGKMIYPSRLAIFYPHPLDSLPTWQPVICFLILTVVSAIVIYTGRSKRFLMVGWFWYLGTLVPVIGLVQVGTQAMADRYVYLPSIGVFIIVAWIAAELGAKGRYRKIGLGIMAGLVFAVLVICTRVQVKYWQNDFTVFKHALEVTKNNSTMHERYATTIFKEGKFEEAINHYKEALRIRPELFQAHAGLGLVFLKQGKFNEAAECFEEALRLKPAFPSVLNNLGALLGAQGKIDEAIRNFEKAIQIDPDYPQSYYNIAIVKIRQKEYSQAIWYLNEALRRRPGWPEVCSNLGESYFSVGDINQAISYWHRALELNPRDIKTLNNLAWVLATTEDTKLRNPTDAVKYAQRACELVGPYQQPVLLGTLAAAYAATGNFTEAVKTAEEAVKLAEAADKKDLAKKIREWLDLYKSGQPYREK